MIKCCETECSKCPINADVFKVSIETMNKLGLCIPSLKDAGDDWVYENFIKMLNKG